MIKETVDIILPVYHEEENIEQVILGIDKYVKTPHITTLVLQDKKDPTIPVITKVRRKDKTIRIIYTQDGKGMLKALRRGITHSTSEIIVITMADLSDDPRDIDKMILKIKKGYDLVCASRYMKGGKHTGGPRIKGFLSYLGCKTLKLLTDIPTNDATNAFKCFRRGIINQITIESEEGFELPLELTVKAYTLGLKITEIPTSWKDRVKGNSQFTLLTNLKFYLKWYFYGVKKRYL
jgi:dolichol-phosphate mannosyltransferase